MKYIKGDLLVGYWDCAIHCANVHRVMGSGIALYLSRRWPEVSQADDNYELNGDERLGNFSKAILSDNRAVYNLYGQQGIGNDGHPLNRNCQYDALYDALYKACDDMGCEKLHTRVGVPYGMGCVRAGGSWLIVDSILADIEEKFPVSFIIYDIGNGEMENRNNPKSSVYIPL